MVQLWRIRSINMWLMCLFKKLGHINLLVNLCASVRFIYQGELTVVMQELGRRFYVRSAEIYKGRNVAGFIDWLPPGAQLRLRLIESWLRWFVWSVPDVYLMDGSTILPAAVFEASGHLENFTDQVIECPRCGAIYRVDHLLKVTGGKAVCPRDGEVLDLTKARPQSLMIEVKVGIGKEGSIAYLRPETAQNIYINYMNFRALGFKLPFAIAQVGRSYRNEISPRGLRLREFVQAEIEEFVLPSQLNQHPLWDEFKMEELPLYHNGVVERMAIKDAVDGGLIPNRRLAFWLWREYRWFRDELGIPEDRIRFYVVPPEERAFYSGGTLDTELRIPTEDGEEWVEVVGNAWRTNYDLSRHSKSSGVNMSEGGVVPHVVEPSFGVDRIAAALIAVHMDNAPKDRQWPLLRIPRRLAPFDVGIATVRSDLAPIAENVNTMLRRVGLITLKLDWGSKISAQYAYADLLGIPSVVTIDPETVNDNTVTIRDRDTKRQIRVNITQLPEKIREFLD